MNMWKSLLICVTLFSIGNAYPCISKLVRLINKNFEYLRTVGCAKNCSYTASWGAAEFSILMQTKTLNEYEMSIVNEIQPQYDYFVDNIRKKMPNDIEVQLLIVPEWAPQTNDYRMVPGRVPKNPDPLPESLEEIVANTVGNEESFECYNKLLENGISDVQRECNLECEEIMKDRRIDYPISFDERVNYITISTLMNCTNYPKEEVMSIANDACCYFARQVKTMYDQRSEPYFQRIKFLYLNKIMFCGTFGFPEFYCQDYIKDIIESINEDGSVGTPEHTMEEKEVLTAQVAVILTSVIRKILQLKRC